MHRKQASAFYLEKEKVKIELPVVVIAVEAGLRRRDIGNSKKTMCNE